jgi:mono/diheme cytochrome c family protein
MWATNLKVLAVVLGTIGLFTLVANSIPQVESEVPQELTLSADVTPDQLVAAGEQIYAGAGGCTACHGLGTRAPNLLTDNAGEGAIGARCGTRKTGMSCKDYLHEAMVKPGAFVVAGFQPIMPDMSRSLSPAQVWSVVAYLESLGGEVTVTGADVVAGAPAVAAGGAPAAGAAPAAATSTDPRQIMQEAGCLNCHKVGSEGQTLGPDLSHIGTTLTSDQIKKAIVDPNADVAKGFEAMKGIMPTTFAEQLTSGQLEALVQYLASQK